MAIDATKQAQQTAKARESANKTGIQQEYKPIENRQTAIGIKKNTQMATAYANNEITKSRLVELNNTKIDLYDDKDMVLSAQMDRRASLTVVPKMGTKGTELFAKKVMYALGTEKVQVPDSSNRTFFNFLQLQLGGVGGLIFPYTPKISQNYTINYETTDIPQSNVQYNSYRNSPPPSLEVTGHFTADKKEMALNMLSAIWFLQAVSKCDVGDGKRYYSTDVKSGGGLPPPVLYFNAYNQMMENIPVVLKSFGFSYPDNIDYVNLILDLENRDLEFYSKYLTEETINPNLYVKKIVNNDQTVNKLRTDGKSVWFISPENSVLGDTLKMSFWLPMQMDITISFLIQPNLSREDNVFNLDAYKAGVLKNPKISATLASNGKIAGKFTGGTKTGSLDNRWSSDNKKYLPTGWSW